MRKFSLDLFDFMAISGATTIGIGLWMASPPACLVWVGIVLLVPSLLLAKRFSSRK